MSFIFHALPLLPGSQSRFPRYACPVQKLKLLFSLSLHQTHELSPKRIQLIPHAGNATNACWALQNLLPEEGKKNLAVDNRNLRIFKDPLPGRVKPTAQRLCSNRSHKIVEGYPDYTQTIAAVLSEVSPEKKGATLIVVTRTGPRPQMLWNTFPSVPRAAARPSNQLPP